MLPTSSGPGPGRSDSGGDSVEGASAEVSQASGRPEDNSGAVTAMSTALLAHQLPPLSRFDGASDGDRETIKQ